jgi:hypothetical protein
LGQGYWEQRGSRGSWSGDRNSAEATSLLGGEGQAPQQTCEDGPQVSRALGSAGLGCGSKRQKEKALGVSLLPGDWLYPRKLAFLAEGTHGRSHFLLVKRWVNWASCQRPGLWAGAVWGQDWICGTPLSEQFQVVGALLGGMGDGQTVL